MNGKGLFLFFFLLLWAVSAPRARAEQRVPFQPWRCPSNGGINVLYYYLRVNGLKLEYSDLLKKRVEEAGAGQDTALTLARLAARTGLPLQPVSLTMDELKSCALPVIVHVDGDTPEHGAFLLVLSIKGGRIIYINGPSASMRSVSVEDFRRVWSGIALLPVTSGKRNTGFCTIGFSAGLILPLVIRFARSPKKTMKSPQL